VKFAPVDACVTLPHGGVDTLCVTLDRKL